MPIHINENSQERRQTRREKEVHARHPSTDDCALLETLLDKLTVREGERCYE